MKKIKNGFSMLEIILVVAVIIIVAVIFGFNYRNYTAARELKSTAQEMVSDLKYARQLARTVPPSLKYTVEIQYGQTSYKITKYFDNNGSAASEEVKKVLLKNAQIGNPTVYVYVNHMGIFCKDDGSSITEPVIINLKSYANVPPESIVLEQGGHLIKAPKE